MKPTYLAPVMTLLASHAYAGFPQATCTPSPGFDSPISANIGGTDFDRRPVPPVNSPDDHRFYNNNVNPEPITYLVNSNVVALKPLMGYFETEYPWDFVEVVDNSGSYQYSGILNSSSSVEVVAPRQWFPIPGGGSQSFTLQFRTNASVAVKEPPRFLHVEPSCKFKQSTFATNSRVLTLNRRYDGLLLKNGDTIYFQVVQPAGIPLVLTLNDKTSGVFGLDWGLYVSDTNPTPDNTNFMAMSDGLDGEEALAIPAVAQQRTLYIGVHSNARGGHFVFNAMAQMPSNRMAMTVCPIFFTATPQNMIDFKRNARSAVADLLAGTNGNLFVESMNVLPLQTSCGNNCDICILLNSGSGAQGGLAAGHPCGRVVNVDGNVWGFNGAPPTLIWYHEWGHACFGLPDEYTGGFGNSFCGHTEMDSGNIQRMFCSNAHCLDGHVIHPSCVPTSSNWAIMAPRIYFGTQYGTTISATPNKFGANTALMNLVQITP